MALYAGLGCLVAEVIGVIIGLVTFDTRLPMTASFVVDAVIQSAWPLLPIGVGIGALIGGIHSLYNAGQAAWAEIKEKNERSQENS
jgi:hypothetical protein